MSTNAGGWQSSDAHTAFLTLLAEVAFVVVLAFLADANPGLGTVILVVLVGLWLVWAVGNPDTIKSWGKTLGIGG
jgi:hypothetical protein